VCDVDGALQTTAPILLYSANATGNSQYAVGMMSRSGAYGIILSQDSDAMTLIRLETSEVSTRVQSQTPDKLHSNTTLSPISNELPK
jgi:hypothetical protein